MAAGAPAREEVALALIGTMGAGKTSLIVRRCENTFRHEYNPTISDFLRFDDVVDGVTVAHAVWDTAGMERFKSITTSALRDRHVVMMVSTHTRPAIVTVAH